MAKDEIYYAIFVSENDDSERLVWFAPDSKDSERKFFIGGSSIMPCIFTAAQSAHAMIKKMRKYFDDNAQFYVRRINILLVEKTCIFIGD